MIGRAIAGIGAAVFIVGTALAGPKVLFHGWDSMDVTPQELLANADAIAACGSDGFAIPVILKTPGGKRISSCTLLSDPWWEWGDVAALVPTLREVAKRPGLKDSLLHFWGMPRPRIAWTDDAAWEKAANNLGVLARLAKESGMKGLNLDPEDYYKTRQFRWIPEKDPDWNASVRLARRRGAEFFSAAFKAFPEMDLVSFFFFALDPEYGKTEENPVMTLRRKKDLWPAFLNGMLDVLPPTAHVFDGDENAYHYEAARHDFYRAASRQLTGLLPLVAAENRAKYRAQNGVSYGFYVDGYAAPTNSPWYVPMVRGSRVTALDENLREAVKACDGYIWVYGEHNPFLRWTGCANARLRRFDKVPTWDEGPLPGFRDVFDMNTKPLDFVARKRAEQQAAGTYRNLVEGKAPKADGNFSDWVKAEKDAVYAVSFDMKGFGRALTSWMGHKGWMWKYSTYGAFGAPDANGVRHGVIIARTPPDGTSLFVCLDGNQKDKPQEVTYSNVEVIRVR